MICYHQQTDALVYVNQWSTVIFSVYLPGTKPFMASPLSAAFCTPTPMKFVSCVAALAVTVAAVSADPVTYDQYMIGMFEAQLENAQNTESQMMPMIMGGYEVPVGTRTFTSGVRSSQAGQDSCGASLISPTHVLTAAHCYDRITHVSIGSHYVKGTKDGEQIAVKNQILHPNYNSTTKHNDFLILELATASKYAPVALAKADDSDAAVGKTATVIGWGSDFPNGWQSDFLRAVEVPIVSNADCAKVLSVDETMLCAGGELKKDSCQYDSGGPLVTVDATGRDVLIGVVSWGHGCGQKGYPGVYARISKAIDWIAANAPGVTFR